MVTKGIVKSGEYYDSVSLMIVAKRINAITGVLDSSVVMGTAENQAILKAADFMIAEFANCSDNDLLAVVKAETADICDAVLKDLDQMLADLRKSDDSAADFSPKSFEGALKALPDANLSLISVAGKYAFDEAMKALNSGLHVMLFSDNVSIEEEIELKKYALSKNLLVMGPDCGTAIINGVPLAFANVVRRGNIGIVAASGTGLQEVSTLIHNYGFGVSQAIGTGGRDVKEKVGGMMFIQALKALADDDETKVLLLVSKPPHASVLEKIGQVVKGIKKPVISVFLGANASDIEKFGIKQFSTLEEGAVQSIRALGQKVEAKSCCQNCNCWEEEAKMLAKGQRYIRALYSGGTFCSETQLILSTHVKDLYSNAPAGSAKALADIWKSQANTVIDLGEDEFTVGKPHPMIDYSTRNKRLIEEAKNPETAFIMLDVVIGYGSNMKPLEDIVPKILEAKEIARASKRHLPILAIVTGTDSDPQNRSSVMAGLTQAGVIVLESNAEMARAAISLTKAMGV